MTKRVLFLCTGNSARSQMAEALVNDRLGGRWEAESAGTSPADSVHPMTLAALAEWGIQHEGHPKPVENFKDRSFDLVITVCDDAEENCPAWLGSGAVTHIGFPDPAAVRGEAEIVLAAFRAVRDGIASRVIPLLEDLEPSTPV